MHRFAKIIDLVLAILLIYFQILISDFYNKIILFDELYQSRNLNHRNGFRTDKQQKIIDKVVSESDRYYYKFLAFLEDFTSKINNNYH